MQKLFPSAERRQQTLAFARREVVSYLANQIMASAEELGDPAKDTKDELAEREARVVSQGIAALRSLLLAAHAPSGNSENSLQKGSGTHGLSTSNPSKVEGPSQSCKATCQRQPLCTFQQEMNSIWEMPAFWKRILCWRTNVGVLIEAYQLVITLAAHQPSVLREHVHMLAPLVYGTVSSSQPETHHVLFAMLLRFGQAAPEGLRVEPVPRSLPEDLFQLLKRGASCGAIACANALLPMAMLMAQHGDPTWATPDFAMEWMAALAEAVLCAKPSDICRTLADAFAEVLVYFVSLHAHAGQALVRGALREFVNFSQLTTSSQCAVSTGVACSVLKGVDKLYSQIDDAPP
jgi:hypothetical protein